MKRLICVVPVVLLCACSVSKPPISHAHLGHALTGWYDTPANRGLLEVAESESMNAWQEVQKALHAGSVGCDIEHHVRNVIHSLNPEHQATGTGQGYGAIAALRKTVKHVQFAAETEDASDNVIFATRQFTEYSNATIDALLLALAQARYAAGFDPLLMVDHLPPVKEQLELALFGSDLDRDGTIGNVPNEASLRQLRTLLEDMVADEIDPGWQPVPKRYLFGVIRLPDGRWGYKHSMGAGHRFY